MSALPSSIAPELRSAPVVAGVCALAAVVAVEAPLVALGLVGVAIATVCFAAWPFILLAAWLIVRPSLDNSGAVVTIADVNPAGMIGVALVAGGGMALVLRARDLPGRPVLLAGAGMLAIGLASLTWSLNAGDGVRLWVGYATPVVVFGLAAWQVRSVERLNTVVAIVLASAVVPLLIGLYQLAVGDFVDKQGFLSIEGPFVHPNGLGFFLLVAIVFATITLFETRHAALRLALGVALPIAVVCLLFTYARSAWIGLVAAIGIIALLRYHRLIGVLALGLVTTALAVPSSTDVVSERFADLSSASASDGDNSFGWRLENWSRMSAYAQDRPLAGHGLGSYLPLSEREFGIYDYNFRAGGKEEQPVYAHNDYLDFAVEIGITGTLLYIAMLVGLGVVMWRARRVPGAWPYALGVLALVVPLVVISGVDNVKGYGPVLIAVMAIGGAVAGAARGARRA